MHQTNQDVSIRFCGANHFYRLLEEAFIFVVEQYDGPRVLYLIPFPVGFSLA